MLFPAQTGGPVDEARLWRALSELDGTLDKLESMFLRRQPFLCGDDITIADLLAVCEIMQVGQQCRLGEGLTERLALSVLIVLSAASRRRAGHPKGPPTSAALEEPSPVGCRRGV